MPRKWELKGNIKGAKGDDGKTPTITAGTVSTLPAGASATAELTPTTGGYALNLGLPAGAPGVNGKDAPTPTLAVGAVSTGTAAASITGTAPNFVLNLTLPAGAKGETGNPSTMALVGAGRPDTPGTLSTANQTAVANAAVGATFTSTDGAGTGAWAWVKTPTGWAVTYADTGWRDITVSAVDPANSQPGGRLFIRRVGNTVAMRLSKLAPLSSDGCPMVEGEWLPLGFRGVEQITFVLSDVGRIQGANGVAGRLSFSSWWKYRFPLRINLINNTVTAADAVGQFDYFTSDAWPTTLPGTPA